MNKTKPKVKFVLSIDTEEEWDWSGGFPEQNCSVNNIQQLPDFHAFCQSLGVRPSYFVDYAVADNQQSAACLKEILACQDSELAAHLHPWCNPPYYGSTREKESHVVNLPLHQVAEKLKQLTEKLSEAFNRQPKAFRTGRWGINGEVLKLLSAQGYTLDSSVYPFYQHKYFDCRGAPIEPYWPDWKNPNRSGNQREIMELPVSVGFNRDDFVQGQKLYEKLAADCWRWFRPVGLAWHLGLLKKLYMCPELATGAQMIELADKLLQKNIGIIHMYMHSSSLLANATGFMKKGEDSVVLKSRIAELIAHLNKVAEVDFCTISEAADHSNKELLNGN
ncbi:polysaccharide deacetylase family protein [Gayadomonas joobiniege]|uniref:polysaccharide deacetylase family protein n=1 Tax=Gayadomonas joobiniege TaxID=1234606 RepID=UPI0003798D35|nr:polysaccharide deacetylase family protein [Gayadomonas joobiniege]